MRPTATLLLIGVLTATTFFLLAVAIIFLGCLREWMKLLRGFMKIVLNESPYVAHPEGA